MTNVRILMVVGSLCIGGSGTAFAASPYGPPGWNTAPDPCRTCQIPSHVTLPPRVAPRPAPNPTHDPDVQRGINSYRRPGS
jgi:hypothetical protein